MLRLPSLFRGMGASSATHPALVSIQGVSEERSASLPVFVAEIELQIDDVDAILSFVRTLETPDQ